MYKVLDEEQQQLQHLHQGYQHHQRQQTSHQRQQTRRLAVLAASLTLLATASYAAPPEPGSRDAQIMAPFIAWIHGQYADNGQWCCDISDGRPLDDDEIRINNGHYEVLFTTKHWSTGDNQWHPVAKESLLNQFSPLGMPIAWLSATGTVYCLALAGSS